MSPPLRNVLVNSTLCFVLAFLLTTIVHESSHFISYLWFTAKPVLYHNSVATPNQELAIHVRIISALAGPVGSLVQGLVCGWIVSRRKANTSVGDLFLLWLSLLGLVNFFGYLMMTPLSTGGDTGKVAELLNVPLVASILIAVGGFAVLIFLILKLGKHFSKFIPAEHDEKVKKQYVYHVMFYPILIGSVVDTALSFPVPAVLSVIYPATSSFAIMSSFGAILKSVGRQTQATEVEKKISIWLVVFFLCGVGINRFLTTGVG